MSTTVRLATYNVQNLFGADDAGLSKPVKAMKAIARTLDLVDAQIVALQEVASEAALTELNGLLRVPYAYSYWQPGNSARGIHLAYLSRLPLRCTSHRELPLTTADGEPLFDHPQAPKLPTAPPAPLLLQRDVLMAEVLDAAANPLSVQLFNVHLKSKANQPWRLLGSDCIRAAEARAIAAIVSQGAIAAPHLRKVVLGDFNDLLVSDALTPLRDLQWMDAVAADHHALGKVGRLPGTYWPRRRMRIDHVLLNPAASACLVAGSAETHISTLAQRGSDHYPVSVDLTVSEGVPG